MPSVVIGQPLASGPQLVPIGGFWSGGFVSGVTSKPVTGVQFLLDVSASGSVYIGLSGGTTNSSGMMMLSGGANSGMLDGIQLAPGRGYFIPKLGFAVSGQCNVYVRHDAACSGQARLFYEIY